MPGNIAQLFSQHLDRPGHVLYRHRVEDTWRNVTVAQMGALIRQWQATFVREEFRPGERIAICLRNGVNWAGIDLAALGLGLVIVPLYLDDNPDNVAWCVRNAQARLLVVETSRQAAALRKLDSPDEPLPTMVVMRPDDKESGLIVAAYLAPPQDACVVRLFADDTLATICFTSGTGGRPKGVMLSHGNILANVDQCRQTNMARPDDLFLSILPLSHMFERTGGYYLPLALGAQVAFARGVMQAAEDLAAQMPTVIFAVPRIFERFHAKIEQSLQDAPFKRKIFDRCVRHGYRAATGTGTIVDTIVAKALQPLVGKPVLERLGGRMRIAVVGGAALDPLLARTFIGLGLAMLQGYGMTEASPVISVNRIDDNVPESVGPPLPGIEVRLSDSGELQVRGANVMQGYWRNPEATRLVLTEDRWLKTGDIAEFTDGKLYIRGRSKDILVLSNGEKLPPQDVEFAILRDPVFEQVMLVGEGRPYVVLLAVASATDEKALLKQANEQLKAFPRWVRVRRVVLSREPWSVDNGMLTPTLKLKRPVLLKKMEREIEAAYTGGLE